MINSTQFNKVVGHTQTGKTTKNSISASKKSRWLENIKSLAFRKKICPLGWKKSQLNFTDNISLGQEKCKKKLFGKCQFSWDSVNSRIFMKQKVTSKDDVVEPFINYASQKKLIFYPLARLCTVFKNPYPFHTIIAHEIVIKT